MPFYGDPKIAFFEALREVEGQQLGDGPTVETCRCFDCLVTPKDSTTGDSLAVVSAEN